MGTTRDEQGGGTTRREALKLAGATAIGGLAASLASSAPAGAAVGSAFAVTNRFSMEVDGVMIAGVREVETIESASQVVYVPGPSGGVSAQPGPVTAQTVRVTKDWSNTHEWYDWRQTVLNGKVDRKSISVIFHNDAGAEVGRMNFFNCWPSSYTGPTLRAKQSGRATETIEIVFETLQLL
jgi:phage tail-like protein